MDHKIDLSTRLGNVTLKNPFVIGSGPASKNVDQIKAAEDAGWAGSSIKLSIDPDPYISRQPRYRWLKKSKYHVFTAEKRLTATQGLKLAEESKKKTSEILVFANMTYEGKDLDGWGKFAKRFEDAGVDVIELNLCCPNMSFNVVSTGEDIEQKTGASMGSDLEWSASVVKSVVDAVNIPVVAKLTPEGGRIAQVSKACLDAGADAAGTTGNRLGIPDIDIHNPEDSIYRLQDEITLGCLSGAWVRPLAFRDTYEIRNFVGPDPFLFSAGGIEGLQSSIQHLMLGADALWVCTQVMLHGFNWLPKILDQMAQYMSDMGYASIRDFRDALLDRVVTAPELTIHDGYAMVDEDKCTGCGRCKNIGHCNAITQEEDNCARVDIAACAGCSTCVDICPARAFSMVKERNSQR